MAEAEEVHHDVHFDSADAGASLTFPQQAGTIRKNGFIVIKNRPCKVGTMTAASRLDAMCRPARPGGSAISEGLLPVEARSEDASSTRALYRACPHTVLAEGFQRFTVFDTRLQGRLVLICRLQTSRPPRLESTAMLSATSWGSTSSLERNMRI